MLSPSVSNNGLQDIRALAKCTQLEYLCLDFTGITTIPPEVFSSMKSLTVLSAQWNQLTALPDTIGSLSSIQQLNFCNNKLTTIPTTIKHLAATIQLLSCLYTHQMSALSFHNRSRLTYQRTVSYNSLATVPQEVFQLSHLQILRLIHNELTELPSDLSGLSDIGILSCLHHCTQTFVRNTTTNLTFVPSQCHRTI